jgi:G3E family GTPase
MTGRLPVHILSGFLGSGKTTLLRRLLAEPDFADSAVIVNELGEIGLDHELVAFAADRIVVLPGGCVCCTIREDVEATLRHLFDARDAGRIPPFRRLIIETTGIALPQPLIFTLHVSPLAASRLEPPQVTVLLDGVLGMRTLDRHPEAGAQLAAADLVIVSKADLASDDALPAAARAINPWAVLRRANLLEDDLRAFLPALRCPERLPSRLDLIDPAPAGHRDIRTSSLMLDTPLDWTAFGVWTTMLLHRHGEQVLRLKAMLDIEGSPGPVVFQCAQHLVHPPEHLDRWPGPDRRSRLVFICRGLDPALLLRSLKAFDGAARRPEAASAYLPAGAGGTIAGRPIRRATAPRWIKG